MNSRGMTHYVRPVPAVVLATLILVGILSMSPMVTLSLRHESALCLLIEEPLGESSLNPKGPF